VTSNIVRIRAARRVTLVLGVLGVLASPVLPACHPAPHDERPNLILILIDTLRADHLGIYGYDRPTSPRIDELGARGVVFENATATSSWTKPSVGSLFTSRIPSEHNAVSFDRHLSPDIPTLAERLREAGYRTVGVTANFVHVNEAWGFDRGFDSWKSFSVEVEDESQIIWRFEHAPGAFVPLRAPNGSEVNREVLERVASSDETPLFLFVHYMEPHAPYTPLDRHMKALSISQRPDRRPVATNDYLVQLARGEIKVGEAERRWLIDLYDAEILGADEAMGDLLDELQSRGYLENAVIVVVSDHGEEFAEHGGWFHALTLYHESIAIPLVIRDTRKSGSGDRRRDPVDLADVPTTLLALAGVDKVEGMIGRALLGEQPLPKRDLVAELHRDSHIEEHIRPRRHRFSLTRWPWKAIVDREGKSVVYRVDRDPEEMEPMETGSGSVPSEIASAIEAVGKKLEALEGERGEPLDPSTLEGLRTLGYAE
jgi:arylsulfatase A-like enzyme